MASIAAGWVATIGGLIAAFLAISTFRQNVKLSRAKWMKELYEKFYEREELKSVRDQLDSGDEQGIAKLVIQETSSFTDYLNFFEFLAHLEESGQVKREDMLGIFGYYLENLKSSRSVLAYIKDSTKGFEKLRNVLEGKLR